MLTCTKIGRLMAIRSELLEAMVLTTDSAGQAVPGMGAAHIVMETALAGIGRITAAEKTYIGCDDSADSAYCSGCWVAGLDLTN